MRNRFNAHRSDALKDSCDRKNAAKSWLTKKKYLHYIEFCAQNIFFIYIYTCEFVRKRTLSQSPNEPVSKMRTASVDGDL